MKINNLYIKDFGIFRNEKLQNLDSNIVVVGGNNRAGKTTFMNILRYLPFGFPKGSNVIPNANVNYEVEAEILLNKERYSVLTSGFKTPKVTSLNSKISYDIEKIFGNIDFFTYKQLFSVTLDELQNLNASNNELEIMKTVFLGAGYKEMAVMPKIIKKLNSEAGKIGGKSGNPSTGQFKLFNNAIKKGVQEKKDASNQIEVYHSYQEELNKIEFEVQEEKKRILAYKDKYFELDIVRTNYELFTNIKELKVILSNSKNIFLKDGNVSKAKFIKNQYKKIVEEIENNISDLTDKNLLKEENRNILIGNKDNIDKVFRSADSFKEKINDYFDIERKNKADENSLKREIANINSKWYEDFENVINIRTDDSSFEELSTAINKFNEKSKEKEVLQNQIQKILDEIKILSNNKKTEIKEFRKQNVIGYFYISIGILVLGIVLSFINKWAGIGTILFSILFGITFLIIKSNLYNNTKHRLNLIKEGIDKNNIDYKNLENKKDRLHSDISILMNKLENYRVLFNLGNDIDYEYLRTYFLRIRELKNRIKDYYTAIYKSDRVKENLVFKLEKAICDLKLEKYGSFMKLPEDNILESYENIFIYADKLKGLANEAGKIEKKLCKKRELEREIRELVAIDDSNIDYLEEINNYIFDCESAEKIKQKEAEYHLKLNSLNMSLNKDRVKEVIVKDDNSTLVDSLGKLVNRYISKEEVIKEITILEEKLDTEEKTLRKHIREKDKLLIKLKELSTLDKFQKAQNSIDSARKELFPIARKYAIYKASICILQELQNNFIEKTQSKLLLGASKILNEITSGEVQEILPHKDIIKYDFISKDKSGNVYNSADILSRATKEQLFLSMRMNRIREHKPNIPIVFDDSFVNFDEKSLYNTGVLLNKISRTNQIFILTCHSRVVDFISKTNKNVKYLFLNNGEFKETDDKSLIKELAEV
ncbi:AAA family ATPase [Clostridium sediminicola]|uniref:ATP-binding protein n=1 Tax=Clostridium sediminicola TaxID=3114879 RepID=UPI0031F24394